VERLFFRAHHHQPPTVNHHNIKLQISITLDNAVCITNTWQTPEPNPLLSPFVSVSHPARSTALLCPPRPRPGPHASASGHSLQPLTGASDCSGALSLPARVLHIAHASAHPQRNSTSRRPSRRLRLTVTLFVSFSPSSSFRRLPIAITVRRYGSRWRCSRRCPSSRRPSIPGHRP
jgi:hypothetical protein